LYPGGDWKNPNNYFFGVVQVEDILFAAGEALSFLWGGVPVTADVILKTNYTSLSMSSNFLTGDVTSSLSKYSPNEKGEGNEDCHVMVRDAITRKLFDVLLYSTRKEERCAGTVWLLSLTMYAGQHPAIQQMLPEIQVCHSFMSQNIYHVFFFILFLIFESYLLALDFC
jgi:proteasome component ECM29